MFAFFFFFCICPPHFFSHRINCCHLSITKKISFFYFILFLFSKKSPLPVEKRSLLLKTGFFFLNLNFLKTKRRNKDVGLRMGCCYPFYSLIEGKKRKGTEVFSFFFFFCYFLIFFIFSYFLFILIRYVL